MSLDASRAMSAKVLIALTSLVLLVHLVVLETSSVALGLKTPNSETPHAFTTRTIALAPPEATSVQAPPAPLAPASPAVTPKTSPPAGASRPTRARSRPTPATSMGAPEAQPTASTPAMEPEPDAPPPPPTVAAADAPPGDADTAPPQPELTPTPAPRPPREARPVLAVTVLPASVRLSYTVQANKFPFSLNSELRWQHDGQRYEAQLAFSAFGQSRVQTSRGEITPEGLAPMRFSDKFRSELAAHFDRDKGRVSFSANTPDAPLLAGAQDRLSILVQLASMVASHPEAYPEATTLAIQTIGPRDADTWLFTVGRPETLVLPGGEQTALKLVRSPRKEFDQRVEVWLAQSMGYLPVRIRITEAGGTYVDQQWQASDPQ